MSISINAINLLVGTESGLIHIYDTLSHQLIRTITNHKGQPIIRLKSIIKPNDLTGHIRIGETSGSREDIPIRPVMPFQRVRDPKARENHEVMVLLPPRNLVRTPIFPSTFPHENNSLSFFFIFFYGIGPDTYTRRNFRGDVIRTRFHHARRRRKSIYGHR